MPKATVRAKARTLPKANAKRLATLKECAALKFEPFSADEMKQIEPPTNKEWITELIHIKMARAMLDKTKDRLEGVALRFKNDACEEIFDRFESTIVTLRGYAEIVECAQMRLMCAGASLSERMMREEKHANRRAAA